MAIKLIWSGPDLYSDALTPSLQLPNLFLQELDRFLRFFKQISH